MACTGCERCNFVWSAVECHVELILFNHDIWKDMSETASIIFKVGVLPELVGEF